MRILGLDVVIPGGDYAEFSSEVSIFEYDVVFWDPVNTWKSYDERPYRTYYRGLPSLGDDESVAVVADIVRRKKEFHDFLELGRVLATFASAPQILYVDTGERRHSGAGRNRQTTRIVQDLNLLDALPFELKGMIGSGTAMTSRRHDFDPVWRKNRERWYYRAILESYPGEPLMVVANTDKVVASMARLGSNGVVLVVPDVLPTPEIEDVATDDDERGATESQVTDSHDDDDPALLALVEWIATLRDGQELTLPVWATSLRFPEDQVRGERLAVLEQQVQRLMDEITDIKAERAKDERWKHLVTASGNVLEDRVREAFQVLGFELVGEPTPGRHDLQLKLDDRFVVVEVKGVSKSASESNAAQLEKWVAEALTDTGIPHKGILVVNAWRDTAIRDRKRPTFPRQMLTYSRSRGHCLLTGLQLLTMSRAVLNGTAGAEQLATEILDCVGPLKGWEDSGSLFLEVETTDGSGEIGV